MNQKRTLCKNRLEITVWTVGGQSGQLKTQTLKPILSLTKGATMATTKRKPVKRAVHKSDDRAKRMLAAKHQTVREFDGIFADAEHLKKRLRDWLNENDVNVETPGIAALDTASRSVVFGDESSINDLFFVARGLMFALEMSTMSILADTLEISFPRLHSAVR